MSAGDGVAGSRAREARLAWSFVLPALAVIVLVALFPLAWTAWESLHVHDLRMPWIGRPFVGLANYAEVLGDGRFWASMGHTLLFTGASVGLELALGLALALAMNRTFRGRGLMRAAVLVPWAIPTVVAALLWRFMFDAEAGIANAVLLDVGLMEEPFVWFIHSAAAWVPVVLGDVWKMTPFVALLLLAGLQNIDESLYEAAEIDGAGTWEKFRYVTLPQLRPIMLFVVVLSTIGSLQLFAEPMVITDGGPGNRTLTVVMYLYQQAFNNFNLGFASAITYALVVIVTVLAIVQLKVGGE